MSKPRGQQCHYCDNPATTRDHIVPRRLLKSLKVQFVAHVPNTVPACQRCNNLKGHHRSTCRCTTCAAAWAVYGPLNDNYRVINVRNLAMKQDELNYRLKMNPA